MKVFALNCGSSTLKFAVLDVSAAAVESVSAVADGVIGIGSDSVASLSVAGHQHEVASSVLDQAEAFALACKLLEEAGALSSIEAVGHRVVHGGTRFRAPARVDAKVLADIETLSELAPLHNHPAVDVVKAARDYFGELLPMVITFDTVFYADLPDVAARYALPKELSERLGIQRFGFHGLAHRYMVERYAMLRPQTAKPRLITLHLGNGCSATASVGGKPVDTSMGFTPLEGLIMGTRSGALDPTIPLVLIEKEGLSPDEVGSLLNTRSGLLGLSGQSSDMRELLANSQAGDLDSDLAVRAFCYSARKFLGAYLAVLGGADAIIIGGGIGEHIAEIREAICSGLEWTGLQLDREKNREVPGSDEIISTDSAAIEAWVIHVDEAVIIARDVLDCLRSAP